MLFGRNDAKAETPVLWPSHAKSWLIGKDFDVGRDWGQEKKGMTEDEMAGWHHWLDGCESEWTPGVGDGQGGLECCDSWSRKELDTTEWLNWTFLYTEEHTEELYKKDLNDQNNHDGVITYLEPDILECEVKWALESITTNKASRGDGIPVELFQILKDDAVKVPHSIC